MKLAHASCRLRRWTRKESNRSSPALWTGIYRSNREALLDALDVTLARLGQIRAALDGDDGAALLAWQSEAADSRRALLEAGLAGGPVTELRAAVPNRPGVIADIALTLGRAGINIVDMSLSPSPDNSSGVVSLWVAAQHGAAGTELIRGLGIPVS